MTEGYCTTGDVRRALQEADFSGALAEDNEQAVVDAITSQAEWLRATTDRHWYEPNGFSEGSHALAPTETRSRSGEEHDIPSTPHPQHSTMLVEDRGRYPRKMVGPFTEVRLDKHYVDELTGLEVRDVSGSFEDWTAASDKEEGEDWELYVEPGSSSSPSYARLRASALPRLQHYSGAVRVSYEYGAEGIPMTVRRAVAMKAAAQLLAPDDDASLQIPDNANLQTVETKVSALERQAEELLEAYE